MSSSLNVVALVSGGKDSLYSILHCIENGHNVVALANLHPSTTNEVENSVDTPRNGNEHGDSDDLNSFMYQTVGHSVIPLQAAAVNLPLYRRAISGIAIQSGRYYAYTAAEPLDETEDLVPLLQEVMQHHADVNAICSGAILSTYQRTRIESVAIRLGLIPLTFLWQYPALPAPLGRDDSITGLLDDMAVAGCDSRIIKAASGGVTESMLWANVTSLRTRNRLVAAMSPFFEDNEFWLRGSVLGEGGEYETLAINGPSQLWKQRIVIEEADNTVVRDDGGASHLRLGKANLAPQQQMEDDKESTFVRIPGLYDPTFAIIDSKGFPVTISSQPFIPDTLERMEVLGISPQYQSRYILPSSPNLRISMRSTPSSIVISNITTTEYFGASHEIRHITKLLQTCIHSLNLELPASGRLSVNDIVFASLLLESMTGFTIVNEEYSKLFAAPNPPPRVTIACGSLLPDNVQVSLSVVLDIGPREKRRGLHVQSRSYWAPANIGPYSQAISVPLRGNENAGNGMTGEVVYVAGQIPLVPQTMEMMQGTFLQQTTLSLQHLWRIGQEREVDLWTHGVAFLAKPSISVHVNLEELQIVWETWKTAHALSQKMANAEGDDENDGPDAWDLKHNPFHNRLFDTTQVRKPSGTNLHPLPRLSVIETRSRTAATTGDTFTPALLIAQVESLPRSAPIEWHSLGLGSIPSNHPRLQLSTAGTQHVSASHCTLFGNTSEPDDLDSTDGSEIKPIDPRPTQSPDTDFVTVQVYLPEIPPPESTQPPPQPLSNILSTISELTNLDLWTIVHGTVYVAGPSGWSILHTLQQTPPWECLITIPCYGVWGAVATEHQDCLRQLSLGLVLRLERL